MYELTNTNKGEPLLEDMAGRFPARLDNFHIMGCLIWSIIPNMQIRLDNVSECVRFCYMKHCCCLLTMLRR